MDLNEVIKNRRSIRSFTNQLVSRDLAEKLISAAMYAPSACNIQGWKFILIDDLGIKKRIVEAGGSILIEKAPLGILVLYDNQTHNVGYPDHMESAAAAIENLLLTATDLGLGACWICHLPPPGTLRKIFGIPGYFSVVAYILVGHPTSLPQTIPRKYELNQLMEYNHFSSNWPVAKNNWWQLKTKRCLVRIYYLIPAFIKKGLLNKLVDKKIVKKFDN